MSVHASAQLHAVATLLEQRADRLDASADGLAARFATATWAGPAADRFRALVVQRRNDMRTGADALRAAAAAMRQLGADA